MRSLAIALLVLLAASARAASQQLPTRATAVVFRFGGADAPEHYAFPSAPELVVDDVGFIYAMLPNAGSVLVFDQAGRYVRTIGRKGEGPGEFQLAAAHGLIGDTLWVRNWPTPRISLFRTDGSHIRTTATPYHLGRKFGGPVGISGLLAGGRAYVDPPSPVIGVDERVHLPLLVGSTDMRNPDTIALRPNPRGLFVPGVGTWIFDPIPPSPVVAVSSRGTDMVVVSWADAEPGAIVVRLFAATGASRWERRLPVESTPLPSSVRDSLIAEGVRKARPQIESARRRGERVPGSVEELVARGLDLPRHYAPARNAVIGIDGTIWIERMAGLRRESWFVLDQNGSPLFGVRVPDDFTLKEASRQWLWGTSLDALDVPYLVKLRVIE